MVDKHFLADHLSLKHRHIVLLSHPEIVFSKLCQECDLMFLDLKDLDKHAFGIHRYLETNKSYTHL